MVHQAQEILKRLSCFAKGVHSSRKVRTRSLAFALDDSFDRLLFQMPQVIRLPLPWSHILARQVAEPLHDSKLIVIAVDQQAWDTFGVGWYRHELTFVIVCGLFRPTYKLNANSPPKNCIDIFVHLYLICVDFSVFDDHLYRSVAYGSAGWKDMNIYR